MPLQQFGIRPLGRRHHRSPRQAVAQARNLPASEIRELERKRLARELHDGVCQDLAAVLWDWPETDDVTSQRTRTRLANVLADLRGLSHSLSPSLVEHLGLTGALRSLAALSRPAVEVEIPSAMPRLKAPQALSIFRIAQEAVHNARKHSGASRIEVRLDMLSLQTVRLMIRDNGTGFSPLTKPGLGLAHMRERAEEMDGDLRCTVNPEGGVTLLLEAPADFARTDEKRKETWIA